MRKTMDETAMLWRRVCAAPSKWHWVDVGIDTYKRQPSIFYMEIEPLTSPFTPGTPKGR